jgi:hypothetical protein
VRAATFDVENLLDNEGMTTWTGAGEMWINRGSTFHNNFGATFRVQNAAAMDTTSQQGGRFFNEGLFEKTSAGTTRINRTRFDHDGMLEVENGVLDIAGGGTSSAPFFIASGAQVTFGTNSPNQVYTAESGTAFLGDGLLRITGNLTVPSGHSVKSERVQLEGQLTGGGDFIVGNSLAWPSGLQLARRNNRNRNGRHDDDQRRSR